jgi:hypothetical protein
MAGRRLTPDPSVVQSVTEIVDPTLAQPMAGMAQPGVVTPTAAMIPPGMVRAQQEAGQARVAAFSEFEQADQPFATFHGDEDQSQGGSAPAPPAPEVVTELDPQERLDLSMLMTIGRRVKKIDVFNHPVVIESLTVGDDQQIGLYCKEYQGAPPADSRSYQIAVCACGIRSVDGVPLYQPLSTEESPGAIFRIKADKLQKWYPATITEIYQAILQLDKEFAELADKVGKSNG